MIRFAIRALIQRKLRTVLTALAIVLGVAMVSGTYVLTDSIGTAFDSIFGETYKNTDAAITGKSAISNNQSDTTTPATFNQDLLARVQVLPEVGAAIGSVSAEAQLIGSNGKAIVFGGAPNLGFSVDPDHPDFDSLNLADGSWPAAGEVVIDRATANKKGLKVGQVIGVQARGPVQRLRISGLVTFGAVSTIGGATLAGFRLSTAQELFDKQGKLDQIRLAAKAGVSEAQLISAVQKILPPGTQVRTGQAQAAEDASGTSSFISFLQTFLLVFGGVALFVGSFVIANSLSITIAQRTREFATLRTLGATRRQVLGSVIVEALVMGVLASVAGLLLGLALAKGLFRLFDAVGFTLPNSGLIFKPRTIVVALLVGILVTVVASLRPARRATRVPPIAAVREGVVLPPARLARFRAGGAVLLAAAGFGSLLFGLFNHGLATSSVLILMLVGALAVFVGVALFASRLVRPMASAAHPLARWSVVLFSVLVWPLFSLPFWLLRRSAWGPGSRGSRVGGFILGAVLNPVLLIVVLIMMSRRAVTRWRPEWPAEFPSVAPDRSATDIGGENSRRDPQRTASTAAALMIGLALVTLVATLAAAIIKPFEEAVDQIFTADYAITAQNNFSPIPPSVAAAVASTAGLESVASVRGGDGKAFGKSIQVTAVDPQAAQVLSLHWQDGSQAVLGQLGSDGAIVAKSYAKSHRLLPGSPISVLTPSGATIQLKIAGIFDPPSGGSPFGQVTISSATFDRNYAAPQNLFTFAKLAGGVNDANTQALEASLKAFPNAKVATRAQFKSNQISGIKSVLNILYVLLALSVVVSLFGIVNTLVLTVFERTRELGMMRAIGMTRRQTRRMIRHESVIIALIGAALGIALGLILAGLLIARVDFMSFALPTSQLITFAVVSVLVGIFAAIFPARRAARLNPLEALQYE
jgi:ABC-type antimicrobial peptide transport system permease subunit